MKFFLHQTTTLTTIPKMSTNLKLLSIEDLEMLLHIQHEKAVREAKVKRLAEEAVQKAEWAAAEAAKKAEEEVAAKAAKIKVRKAMALKKWKATEVDSGSEPEPGAFPEEGEEEGEGNECRVCGGGQRCVPEVRLLFLLVSPC
jgi:hypothetical protein